MTQPEKVSSFNLPSPLGNAMSLEIFFLSVTTPVDVCVYVCMEDRTLEEKKL